MVIVSSPTSSIEALGRAPLATTRSQVVATTWTSSIVVFRTPFLALLRFRLLLEIKLQ